MLGLLARCLAATLPTRAGVVVVTCVMVRALPGNPAAYFAGPAATREAVQQIRCQPGLDQPLWVQFGRYLVDLARGDLGVSITTGQPVLADIAQRLPASAELPLLGLRIAAGLSVPMGVAEALGPNSWVDHLCRVVATAGVSLPTFFTGLLLVYVFYYLPARPCAGAAWAARCLLLAAAARHRLLRDRQPGRGRGRDRPRRSGAARPSRRHPQRLRTRANRADDARGDARGDVVRLRPRRPRRRPRGAGDRRPLRSAQRGPAGRHHARDGALRPAWRVPAQPALPPPVLAARGLCKRYRIRGRGLFARRRVPLLHAVDRVALTVSATETAGLVGESSYGKTTLTRLLARLIDPTEGMIRFGGEDIAAIPAGRFPAHPARALVDASPSQERRARGSGSGSPATRKARSTLTRTPAASTAAARAGRRSAARRRRRRSPPVRGDALCATSR